MLSRNSVIVHVQIALRRPANDKARRGYRNDLTCLQATFVADILNVESRTSFSFVAHGS